MKDNLKMLTMQTNGRIFCAVILQFLIVPVIAVESKMECAEGHFRCLNVSLCVPQSKNCDLIEDCPDGSDELDCDDPHGNLYWDHLFVKRPAAEHDDDLDRSCHLLYNGSCHCRRKELFCQNREFVSPPTNLPTTRLDLLDFTGNTFINLTSQVLYHVPEVNTLVLSHCRIKELTSGVFRYQMSMEILYLDNNDIRFLPASVFPKTNELRKLILSQNQLSSIEVNGFETLTQLRELDLRDNKLTRVLEECLKPLVNLNILYLNGNRLTTISGDSRFPVLPLTKLSLADNQIDVIEPLAFHGLRHLNYLFLSGNRLRILRNGTFEGLDFLTALNLNNNYLEHFDLGVFIPIFNLTSLNLKNNQFKMLDRKLLRILTNLKHIYFSQFAQCLAASHVRACSPHGDGISSREHLLDNPVLRSAVWMMGIIGCAANLLVLLGRRLLARDTNAVHSLYIRNLAMSDLLMGVYLFVIAGADRRYRGDYIIHEYHWRHSVVCNFCGFLSSLSCQSSALILSLVTWDRLVSVTKPLTRKQPSSGTALLHLFTVWFLSTVVALTPITGIADFYFGDEFYGNNGVCLSLHIHEPYAKGWEYSAVMFIFLNSIALAFVCYAYCRMFREIKSSGVALRSTQESQERAVAQRFGIIVLTDCMCWVPVIIVKLVALSGFQISQALYAWLAVLVLPINSALNPVLYTLTTTRFKQQVYKICAKCCDRRFKDIQHSGCDSGGSLSFGLFSLRGSSRRLVSFRTNQSSLTNTKSSWKRRSTAV